MDKKIVRIIALVLAGLMAAGVVTGVIATIFGWGNWGGPFG